MPRASHLLPVTVLASALTLSCGDQLTPTELAKDPRPSLRTEQNPEGPGAQVIRFGFQFIFINDPDRDFSLTIGTPIEEAPECGGSGEVTAGTIQVVTTPAELERFIARVRQGEMTLYGRFSANPCELTEADVVARGQGNANVLILTRSTNVLFTIQATGTVELTGGGLAHLVVKGHFHIEPDGTLRVHVDRFKLTPIGG
jgi:hypothetical protein